MEHRGLALVEILQPCPVYNNINTKEWYAGEDRKDTQGKAQSRLYKLQEIGFDPVVHDESEDFKKKLAGIEKAYEWGEHIPIGVFYQNMLEPTFEDRFRERIPFYLDNPPAKQLLKNTEDTSTVNLDEFIADLKTTHE